MEKDIKKEDLCWSCLLEGKKRKGFKNQDNQCNQCYDRNRPDKGFFHVVEKLRF